ncbi:unnamed protein product [Prorocentrum cordatum]|uniref:Uncharacterized protein n=1 Tax=Prorocentrum cordatum TaxID=2364126 RepID=A0ABN9TPN7_9DINO|nr:unnamed protein product [Polarella glacialis]
MHAAAKASESTGTFVFTHRLLEHAERLELPLYLREKCTAKFVDLSGLDNWDSVSLRAIAAAVKYGLRSTRSLVLDGIAIGCRPEVFEDWCAAFEEHPGLQHVSLRHSGLDDSGAQRLAQVLHAHPVLFSLDLSHNRVGDAGVAALAEALEDNHALLELCLEGTDASEATLHGLAMVLERNSLQLTGRGSPAQLLRGLRRARADARTSSARLSADAAGVTPSTEIALEAGACPPGRPPLPPRGAFGAPGLAPRPEAEQLFFAADGPSVQGLLQELARRCEAPAPHGTASQREVLCELRCRAADLRCRRQLERQRGEEALGRVAAALRDGRERLGPQEEQLRRLKEELAEAVECTKAVLEGVVGKKVALKSAADELQRERQQTYHDEVTAEKLVHDLRLWNEEVAEEAQQLERDLHVLEASCERLAAEGERSRRLLHALSFETDRESFKPSWVLQSAPPPGAHRMVTSTGLLQGA